MTTEQRLSLERAFEANSQTAARLFEQHLPEVLDRSPDGTAWSATACLVHLNLSAAAMVPLLEDAVAKVRTRGLPTGAVSRADWLGSMIRWALEPGRLRSRTTDAFLPRHVGPASAVLDEFIAWHERVVRVLRSAEGLGLSAVKIVSPFDRRVRYNAYAAFTILETHERRHLLQASQAASRAAAATS